MFLTNLNTAMRLKEMAADKACMNLNKSAFWACNAHQDRHGVNVFQASAHETTFPKKNTVAKHNSMVVPTDFLTLLGKGFAEHLCEEMPRRFVCTSLPQIPNPDFLAVAARRPMCLANFNTAMRLKEMAAETGA